MESTVILNGLIAGVLRSLTDRSFDVVIRVMCVEKDVEILTRLLEAIMAVIREADGHQVLAQSEAADYRLKKLREIAYEAENIIDLFRIEVGSSRPQVRYSFYFDAGIIICIFFRVRGGIICMELICRIHEF
jgi:hypothetical protein